MNIKKLLLLLFISSALGIQAQLPNNVPANGLVGWWPFNANANDESGNGNDGTTYNVELTTDRFGKTNSAYYFSGNNCESYIDAQIDTQTITQEVTVSFWVSRTDEGCIAPRIMKFYSPNDGPGTLVFNWDDTKSYPSVGFVTSNYSSPFYDYNSINYNMWSHIVFTNDGNVAKLYQNGQLISTQTSVGTISLAENATFGRMTNPAYDAFNGKIDDIGIWNRVLSENEITALYDYTELPDYLPANGLVAWWPFNKNAIDESGNGNDGTVNGALLTPDRFGNPDSAYYFSGENCTTYIDAQIDTQSITQEVSISFWVSRSGDGCIAPRIMKFYSDNDGPGTHAFNWDNIKSNPSVAFVTSSYTSPFFDYNTIGNNSWTHIVFTNDGNTATLYQNGQIVSSHNSTGTVSLAGNANFGRMTNPAHDALNGKIDDIGIWNRSLTPQEAQALFGGSTLSTKSNALQKELLAYPNPVKDYLNIHNLDKSQNFTIFDLLGKTILKGEIKAERGILNVSGLQTGVYVLKLNGTSQSIRFLKK